MAKNRKKQSDDKVEKLVRTSIQCMIQAPPLPDGKGEPAQSAFPRYTFLQHEVRKAGMLPYFYILEHENLLFWFANDTGLHDFLLAYENLSVGLTEFFLMNCTRFIDLKKDYGRLLEDLALKLSLLISTNRVCLEAAAFAATLFNPQHLVKSILVHQNLATNYMFPDSSLLCENDIDRFVDAQHSLLIKHFCQHIDRGDAKKTYWRERKKLPKDIAPFSSEHLQAIDSIFRLSAKLKERDDWLEHLFHLLRVASAIPIQQVDFLGITYDEFERLLLHDKPMEYNADFRLQLIVDDFINLNEMPYAAKLASGEKRPRPRYQPVDCVQVCIHERLPELFREGYKRFLSPLEGHSLTIFEREFKYADFPMRLASKGDLVFRMPSDIKENRPEYVRQAQKTLSFDHARGVLLKEIVGRPYFAEDLSDLITAFAYGLSKELKTANSLWLLANRFVDIEHATRDLTAAIHDYVNLTPGVTFSKEIFEQGVKITDTLKMQKSATTKEVKE